LWRNQGTTDTIILEFSLLIPVQHATMRLQALSPWRGCARREFAPVPTNP
jgi:hypothetical protein